MASSIIFITGASGFIGSQVVLDALKAGHRLRVNVRRESQIQELSHRFSPASTAPNQLEFVVNPDLSNRDAIRKSLDNVNYIFHIASPMPGSGEDFKTDYLRPAVESTEAILEAAALVPSVKRVVITSSLLALMPLGSLDIPGFIVKEGANRSIPINPDAPFPSGPAGNGPKYSASKILAHRATLEWMSSHHPHFDLITLHPTFVAGYDHTVPASPPTSSGPGIGGSGVVNTWVLNSLSSGKPIMPGQFVDVRDVSKAHLGSLNATSGDKHGEVTEVLLPGPEMSWESAVQVVQQWEVKNPGVLVNKMSAKEGTYPAPFIVEEGSRARALKDFGIGEWVSVEKMMGAVLDQVRDVTAGNRQVGTGVGGLVIKAGL